MKIQLTALDGHLKDEIILVDNHAFMIGRAEDCDCCLHSSDVSQQHCIIYTRENTVTILDLGSEGGTYINGNRISPRQVLQDGDELTIGTHSYAIAFVVPSKAKGQGAELQKNEGQELGYSPEAPESEILFDISYKNQNISATKTRRFQLALTGELLPDDVAGTKIFADSVEGIVFSGDLSLAPPVPISLTDSAIKRKKCWYYRDVIGARVGPVTSRELKELAKQGVITPETLIENVDGKSGLARKVKGLVFPSPATETYALSTLSTISDPDKKYSAISETTPKKTTWFYYDETGEKLGPFTNGQLRKLAKQGVVTPETRIENVEGQSALAKNASGFRFCSPTETVSAAPVNDHTTTFGFDNNVIVSPFSIEGETVVKVDREPLSRPEQKKSVFDEIKEKFENPIDQGLALLHEREILSPFKVKVISSLVTLACFLCISWLFASFWWGNPYGTVDIVGTLTLDGNPVSGVIVILYPHGVDGLSAVGVTDSRGRFKVTTRVGGRQIHGIMVGEYNVIFTKLGEIPERFSDSETSGIAPIRVEATGERAFTFDLLSMPPAAPTFWEWQQEDTIPTQPTRRMNAW